MKSQRLKYKWLALVGLVCLSIPFIYLGVGKKILAEKTENERESAPDRPGEEEDLNREIWKFAKGTSYDKVLPSVAQKQARSTPTKEVRLPNGWKLSPAGSQVELGKLPYEGILYANHLVVLNTGFYGKNPQEVSIIDPKTQKLVKTIPIPSLFPSAIIGEDKDLYISGGFDQKIYRFNQNFEAVKQYPVKGYTGGLAPIDPNHIAIAYLVTENATTKGYEGGKLAILNTKTGKIEREVNVGYFPYSVNIINDKLYVTLLGENKLLVYDPQLNLKKTLKVGGKPMNLCTDGKQIYVVNSNSDSLDVIDSKKDEIVDKINLRYQNFQYGTAPTSCAIYDNNLYVTQAELNAIGVFDKAKKQPLGFIPTGWYPTKILVNQDQLFTLNAKGIESRRPNPKGPQPINETNTSQYVLNLLKGTLSILPKNAISPGQLKTWTKEVEEGSPLYNPQTGFKLPIHHVFYIVKENRTYDQILGDLGRGNGDASLTLFGKKITPVHHDLAQKFVTLDNFYANGEISVLGHSFTTSGYGSPFLEWLGNIRYTGRYNSYPFGIVPATFSPAYLWNILETKGVDYRIYGEPYYLFTRLYQIITETYGEDSDLAKKFYAQSMKLANNTDRGKKFNDTLKSFYGKADTQEGIYSLLETPELSQFLSTVFTGDDSLAKALKENPKFRQKFSIFLSHYPVNYRSWDLAYSDIQRFIDWKTDFEKQVKSGKVPSLHYIWLPNDHTAGMNPLFPNPYQLVAQNDAALGKIVETISQSPIWKESLIIVVEDDAQNGADHVDATRTVSLVASPYVKRGAVVSDTYDQLGILRTIELVLGLDPINMNDGLAAPMFNIFTDKPDFSPYFAPSPSTELMESDKKLYQELR